jgi:penicillin amidase
MPGMAPYFGSVEYMRASDWRTFIAALNRWGAPSENQVYADVDGNIGYKAAGLFPNRPNWDGLLPVPGDGRYEWDGFHDMDVLPEEYNPERGFAGTANAMNLPAGYPIDRYRVGFEWNAPWRYRRLMEVLAAEPRHTLADSLALQRDYISVLAREALTRLPDDGTPAASMLRGWNAELGPDSAAAALWAIWYHRHLVPAMITALEPQVKLPGLDTQTVLAALADPANTAIISNSLAGAWQEAVQLLGDDPSAWSWGALHQIQFRHPLLASADPELAARMTYPAWPRGGSANTTNNTGFSAADFLVASGASFRMVLDVGNWDAARITNAPGQSGVPGSMFYANLLQNWATEGSVPLYYSRKAVEQHTVLRYTLAPAHTTRSEPEPR